MTVVKTVALQLGESMPDAWLSMRQFKGQPKDHKHRKALLHLNITLSGYCPKKADRYLLVSSLVGRKIESTYDLDVAEVYAILDLQSTSPERFDNYINLVIERLGI